MTFVLWGLYNGLFLILERIFLGDLLNKIPKFLTHAYALLVVLIGWVLFRADNISQAFDYLSVMFFYLIQTIKAYVMEKFLIT